MAIITSTVAYKDDDVVLEAYIAFDDAIKGMRPAVLVSHAWSGREGFVAEKARKLAEMGYVGFALDMYGQGIRGASVDENTALMQPFIDDRAMLQKRIVAAFYAVRQLPWVDQNHIAAIGFCFGGLCVLDLARSGLDLKGVVSFHGLLSPPENLEQKSIKAKVLVLHGNDDPMVPVDHVIALQQELTTAGVDWQIHTFGQTMHAFTNPVANDPEFGTVYQADADRRSWQLMQNFLSEIFAS